MAIVPDCPDDDEKPNTRKFYLFDFLCFEFSSATRAIPTIFSASESVGVPQQLLAILVLEY